MRIQSSVTAITWLPFAALDALPELPIGIAVAHHDEPPPVVLGDLDELRDADRFREANQLDGWIEVERGRIVDYGREGRSVVTGAGLDFDGGQIAFPAIEFPVLRPEPELGDGFVRFQQTVGGRIGFPVPRPLRGRGYFHIGSAQAWTTLELIIRADGSTDRRLVASSPFPHHSLYGDEGRFISDHGLTDFVGWYREWHDESPWTGDELEDELDWVAIRKGPSFSGVDWPRRDPRRAGRPGRGHVPAARGRSRRRDRRRHRRTGRFRHGARRAGRAR